MNTTLIPVSAMPSQSPPLAPRNEDLILPQEGDSHPCSGWCRVIENAIFLEINRIAAAHNLPIMDELDEDRYLVPLAPVMRQVKAAWSQQNPYPLKAELRKVQMGIREFDRWRRKPSTEELTDLVCNALGLEKSTKVAGGDAEARRVVTAPKSALPLAQPAHSRPAWLEEFAEVVGDNELLAKTAILPLLNMSDGAARRAILMMKAGRQTKQAGDSINLQRQRASTERRKARTDFVGSLLSEIKATNRKEDHLGDGSTLKDDWGMPGFIRIGRFDEGDNAVLGYAPGRLFKPTGIPGKVTGWVPVEQYRAYLIGLGHAGEALLQRLDAEHGVEVAA